MNDLAAVPTDFITDFDAQLKLGAGNYVGLTFEVYGTRLRGYPQTREMPREDNTIDVRKVMCNGVDVTHWLNEDWFSTAFFDQLYQR